MIVYVITDVDLTTPGAVVSRLLSYSRGLSELGISAVSCWLSNSQNESSLAVSQYPGLEFWFGQVGVPAAKGIIRLLRTSNAARRLAAEIETRHQAAHQTVVLYYGMMIPERFPIQKVCDKLRIKTFDEITEFPYLARKRRIMRKIQYRLFMNRYLSRDRAVFCISTAIQAFLQDHLHRLGAKTQTQLFGIMVETDKFAPESAPQRLSIDPSFYIAYCGTMYGNKDGIPDLVRALSIAIKTYPDLKLVLIGDNSAKDRLSDVIALIDLLSIQNNVIFTGRVDFSTMHRLLCGAEALVLSKPDNIQNEGAFPTKLGEYLACGRPVIATSVGDIPHFLEDGVNAYLSPGSDPDAFAAKICECLADHERAALIAAKGKQLADEVFHYRVKAGELMSYLFDSVGE